MPLTLCHRRQHCLRLFALAAALLLVAPPCFGESLRCLGVYRDGGAPAVFDSIYCPRWTLDAAAGDGLPPGPLAPRRCDVAVDQGRRRSQEDRAVCALGLRIPFLERMRIKEIDVGVIAVFDGHNGAEASEMASKLLLEYFLLHVYFLLDGIYSIMFRRSSEKLTYNDVSLLDEVLNLCEEEQLHYGERSSWSSPAILDRSFHMKILKESLLRTIHDIDLIFSQEALLKNFQSGSTAAVILIADGQVVAANVGDSKAFLCSKGFYSHRPKGNWPSLSKRRRKRSSSKHEDVELENYTGPTYYVKELTKDHHPDREDERSRVEAAGGYVLERAGVYRVNGELALSRAIGDVPYKRFGVISTPELTGWKSLSTNDSFLIAASDGVFEKMTMQDVCDLMLHDKLVFSQKLQSVSTVQDNLASNVIHKALQKGTTDNVAAVVVPLGLPSIPEATLDDWYNFEETFETSILLLQAGSYQQNSDDAASSRVIQMEYFKHASRKFERFLVEAKLKRLGCFYLSESLDEDTDYIFLAPDAYPEDGNEMHELNHIPVETALSYDGSLERYKDRNFCWYFGHQGGENGRCNSPEVFAKFFGLLDYLSHGGSISNSSHSFRYKIPDFRYKLKKTFDRGSYGEVWLAFHWNCSGDGDLLHDRSYTSLKADSYNNCKTSNSTSANENCVSDARDGDLFILKRIMVERGTAAYLSGLREKYFGELFLNASITHGGLSAESSVTAFSADMQFNHSDMLQKNMSASEEVLKHIARFIESFESELKEIWLVYHNEGRSLSKLIYTAEETKLVTGENKEEKVRHIQVLHPSKWWYWLRTTKAGQKQMQNLIWQLLMAVKACHDRNITHRDIKPENMIICFEDLETGKCLRDILPEARQTRLNMRIIDFGSAIDDFTVKHLYGSGPSRSEQTFEYTPPEALLNANWFQGSTSARLKYDMWSVGVVMLELILGSPHVFQISDRTRVLLDQHLDGWSEHTKELAYKLRSYMELCILVPGISSQHQSSGNLDQGNFGLASWKCSEESFSYQVKIRDPLKMGFTNVWALRLVRQLLVWHPEDRLNVDEALSHPYFQQQP